MDVSGSAGGGPLSVQQCEIAKQTIIRASKRIHKDEFPTPALNFHEMVAYCVRLDTYARVYMRGLVADCPENAPQGTEG